MIKPLPSPFASGLAALLCSRVPPVSELHQGGGYKSSNCPKVGFACVRDCEMDWTTLWESPGARGTGISFLDLLNGYSHLCRSFCSSGY